MAVDPGSHTPRSRDFALRRLSRTTRWMIAGSVALTGVLSEVAANAFPGKTIKTGPQALAAREAAKRRAAAHQQQSRQGSQGSQGSTSSLQPPATTPQATPEAHTEATPETHVEAAPEQHSEATPETHVEATPEQHSEATPHTEATPETHVEAAPEQRSEATTSSPPASSEAPVVSGAS